MAKEKNGYSVKVILIGDGGVVSAGGVSVQPTTETRLDRRSKDASNGKASLFISLLL